MHFRVCQGVSWKQLTSSKYMHLLDSLYLWNCIYTTRVSVEINLTSCEKCCEHESCLEEIKKQVHCQALFLICFMELLEQFLDFGYKIEYCEDCCMDFLITLWFISCGSLTCKICYYLSCSIGIAIRDWELWSILWGQYWYVGAWKQIVPTNVISTKPIWAGFGTLVWEMRHHMQYKPWEREEDIWFM